VNRTEYRMVRSEQGRALGDILGMAASDPPATKSQLRAAMEQAGITDPDLREKIGADCIELAKLARDGDLSAYVARQIIDEKVLGHLKAMHTADSLLGDEPDWSEPDADSPEILDAVDRVRHPHETEEQTQRRRADEADRARLRELGVIPRG